MSKMKAILDEIYNCQNCNGLGNICYGDGDEFFDYETCECNPYGLILDRDGDVLWDDGLLLEAVAE